MKDIDKWIICAMVILIGTVFCLCYWGNAMETNVFNKKYGTNITRSEMWWLGSQAISINRLKEK